MGNFDGAAGPFLPFPPPPFPMSLRDALFSDLDLEADATRQMLAAVPWDRADWRPHERSMTLGALARHIAVLPRMGAAALTTDGLDLGASRPPSEPVESTEALLAAWDGRMDAFRAALAEATDEALGQDWTLSMGGRALSTSPRHQVVRRWTLSHIAHHRGQLSVYLRLLDVPVPGTYGPTADTPPQG